MKYRKSFSARLRGTFAFFLVCAFMLAPLSVSAKTAPTREDLRVSSRILDLFRDKESANISTRYLCPGGQAFGMKIRQDGVTVSAITDTSSALGKLVKVGDILLSFNGETIESATDFCQKFSAAKGSCSLTFLHDKQKKTVLIPRENAAEDHRLGIEIKDTAAGIGTVTYIDPATGDFGGLGHGICTPDTGEIYPMRSGAVTEVILGGVIKSAVGKPGELRGVLGRKEIGTLYKNTDCGVFGQFVSLPQNVGKTIGVAMRDEIREGEANIVCTLDSGSPESYTIEIISINKRADGSKCFMIKIKDARLIEKTGGIVQGMSGSPIIQGGKLVGAVTHVMVNDPTCGYGIFIENMLNQMYNPAA